MPGTDSHGGPEIARLTSGWVDGSLDSSGQTRLIRLAAEIVLFRLRSRLAAAASTSGHDHLQLALWAITPLFAVGPGPASALSKSWLSAPPGNDPADVVAWLESRVVQTAKRELQRLIGENNPYEYRLRRRLLRALHKHPLLLVFPATRPEYVCLRAETELSPHLPHITLDEVREAIASARSSVSEIRELLGATVTLLSRKPARCHTIPLWTLYEGFAELERAMAVQEFEVAACARPAGADLEIAVKEAVARATSGVDPILRKHIRLGKLTLTEAGRIRAGTAAYLQCFARDGAEVPLMSCLQESWPELTDGIYRSKYAKMFEYVISVARARFIEHWER